MDSADAAHNDAEGDRRERSFPSGQSRRGTGHPSDHASRLAMGALHSPQGPPVIESFAAAGNADLPIWRSSASTRVTTVLRSASLLRAGAEPGNLLA
jgi:hypothetical protein